jgi:RNA polymerase sigma-70 factor (ECF subfamily)
MLKGHFSASDEQLMWRVKLHDDESAFAKLMERWESPIRNLCARMTGDLHEAEDLCQTAFTRVFARRADWEPQGKFSTFLWRVALNLCHDHQRKVSRRQEWPLEPVAGDDSAAWAEPGSDEPLPSEHASLRERADLVQWALAKLRPLHREIVVLRHFEGLKFCEIAEVLSIPEGTTKSRMAEALSHLQSLLKVLNEDNLWTKKQNNPELLAL